MMSMVDRRQVKGNMYESQHKASMQKTLEAGKTPFALHITQVECLEVSSNSQ